MAKLVWSCWSSLTAARDHLVRDISIYSSPPELLPTPICCGVDGNFALIKTKARAGLCGARGAQQAGALPSLSRAVSQIILELSIMNHTKASHLHETASQHFSKPLKKILAAHRIQKAHRTQKGFLKFFFSFFFSLPPGWMF